MIVDVRIPEEFADGHLESAVNIDVQAEDFAAQVGALDPAGHSLIWCRSGNRSTVAGSVMTSLSFDDLTDPGGALEASAATGRVVAQDGRITGQRLPHWWRRPGGSDDCISSP